MKSKLILLSILFFGFIGFIAVRFLIFDKQKERGRLQIRSSPTASVFVDNTPAGTTPYEGEVKVGEHELKLIPQGEATDTASWKRKITTTKNTLTYVNVELGSSDLTTTGSVFWLEKVKGKDLQKDTGEVTIETDPAGAIVSLDNDEKGPAALLANVAKGGHEIAVSLPGFFPRREKINVEPGFRLVAYFKLAIDKSQKKPDAKKEATESASVKKEENKTIIVIGETGTGFLRVREEASINASESARVTPGDEFEMVDEEGGWYKIEYETGKQGWISGEYATKKEETSSQSQGTAT